MTLFVVPTPIGNLEDITLRALRVLREADIVACEDTRRTGRLLKHYDIEAKLTSYHDHNENHRSSELVEKASTGDVALVSDAGTPLVSDPGYALVTACIEAGVDVEVLPGASSLLVALASSGLPTDTVVFVGFPPRKGRERTGLMQRIGGEGSTFILFESPKRLAKTLGELPEEASVAVCRELTKLHEEVFRGTVAGASEHFSGDVKGEIVVVVEGGTQKKEATPEDAIVLAREYAEQGESKSRSASRAAKETGLRKQEIYDALNRE